MLSIYNPIRLSVRNLSKRDCSILIGNAVDHFDTALYSFLAPLFAAEFFPSNDPAVSLIIAYSVLGTTIITRPLGSYIFSLMANNHGPAMSLSYSLIGIGITSFTFGLLPTYAMIGPLAPLLLIILRSLGGVFSAGEITIAKLYILSDRSSSEAFKNSYLYQTSVMIGIVFASYVSSISLSHEQSSKYCYLESWRIWFIIGGILALFGYILRTYKTEKLAFMVKQSLKLYSFSGTRILFANKLLLLKVALVSGFSYMTYCLPFIVMNNLIPEFTDISLDKLMPSNSWLLVMDMLILPIMGIYLAKFKPEQILACSTICLALTILPVWHFIYQATFSYIIFVKIWIIIIGIIFSCGINLWLNNLIKTDEKYLITGIGNAIGTSLIGKMAPFVCLTLYHHTGSYMVAGWFILVTSCLTIWAIIT